MENISGIGNTSVSSYTDEKDLNANSMIDDINVLQNDMNNNNDNNNDNANDDVIPNAIVIKNIPFAIKKEQLLDIIDDMNLPLPYAFNYHFDNGIFRGLAFANFTTAEETTQVIDNLNGKEINGRKLKVEYKKMLPQAERERIEREKREKRGQLEEQHRTMSNLSLQSLNRVPSIASSTALNILNSTSTGNINNNNNVSSNNNINNSNSNQNNTNNNQLFSSFMTGSNTNLNSNNGNNQPLLSAQNTSNSFYQQQNNSNSQYNLYHQQSQPQQSPSISNVTTNNSTERYYAPLPSSSTVPIPPQQLDFNDPDTLEIYSQLLLFKDREKFYYELAYPIGLSANHKRIINVLCSFLNLVEIYDPRFVIIRRKVLDQASLQNHLQQQGQLPMMHPLQANSTGGSMNRSHSYTSLLQAHATATAAAAAASSSNNNNGSTTATPILPSNSLVTSPTLFANPLFSSNDEQLQQPQPQSQSQVQTAQQQQQSFLRQQATLTPSSRIPSGYSSNTQQLNSVNPLLRNSNSILSTPSGSNIPQRILSSLHNSGGNSSNSNNANSNTSPITANTLISGDQQQLQPQNTNGSVHSNFSIQSFHDDGVPLSAANPTNGSELMYKTLSHSAYDGGLEHSLSRSLSGLDLQNNESTATKKNVW